MKLPSLKTSSKAAVMKALAIGSTPGGTCVSAASVKDPAGDDRGKKGRARILCPSGLGNESERRIEA